MPSEKISNKKKYINKTKINFYLKIKEYQKQLKPTKNISGYGANVIVGEKNYPNLSIHSISNEDIKSSYKNTSNIIKEDYSQIIKLKAKNILGSTSKIYSKNRGDRIKQEISDIYKARKPVLFESEFDSELKFDKVIINKVSGIGGSCNELVSLDATENISTSKNIEKYTQSDIKTKEAVISLYEKGVCEHQIINLLAMGNFGVEFNKKLTPTRWAITAYDRIVENYLHKKIIKNNVIYKYEVYHIKDKGNEFVVILLPESFSCEIVETFVFENKQIVEKDFVGFDNVLKKSEPETAGGFYATKIGIFENLKRRKRQASFISIRIIKDYDLPLGVVLIRELIRDAMKKQVFICNELEELEDFLKLNFFKHFLFFKNSRVLKELKKQKKLNEFF